MKTITLKPSTMKHPARLQPRIPITLFSTLTVFILALAMVLPQARAQEPPVTAGAGQPEKEAPLAESIPKGLRVFTCGNSFHIWVASWLSDMAESAGIKDHQAGKAWIGSPEVMAALRADKVDVLTMAVNQHPDDSIEKYARAGLAANPDFRVTVQETWIPADGTWPEEKIRSKFTREDFNKATGDSLRKLHAPYFKEFDESIRQLNQKLGKQVVFVAPVGQAVIALREKVIAGQAPAVESQSDIFVAADGLPNVQLQALTTYCHYAVIYHRCPVGLPLPLDMQKTELDQTALNRLLQEIAWDAVTHHPLSGMTADTSAKAAAK
ncbi:MAG: hypothetical protein WC789_03615 [Lentisphaeria bacterium]|jgi:hypothetical protein